MQVWGRVGLGRTAVRAGQENPLAEARAGHVSRRSPDGNPSRRMESQAGAFASLHWIMVHTIRFYEQSGLLPAPHRTPAGYRSYDQDAVTRLRFVRSAQTLGLSLAEIAEVLRIRDYQGPPCSYVAELLETHISALDTRIKELRCATNSAPAAPSATSRTRPAAESTRSAI
jgi:MerR family transcriptional regulator, copper efflux regulator